MAPVVPESLLGLPAPWDDLTKDPTECLPVTLEARATALDVLDRCLQAAAELPDMRAHELPASVTVAWSLWARSRADEMPRFGDFSLEPIRRALARQVTVVTDDLVLRCGQVWLRERALDRAHDAQDWLIESLREAPSCTTIDSLRAIVQSRWRTKQWHVFGLIYDLWLIDPAGSRVLIRSIATAPAVPSELSARLTELVARSPSGQ